MTRADELRAELEAELEAKLEYLVLEEEMIALKASGDDPKRLREVKNKVRELRCVYRLAREGWVIVDGQLVPRNDAVVAPATVQVSAGVHSPGGAE